MGPGLAMPFQVSPGFYIRQPMQTQAMNGQRTVATKLKKRSLEELKELPIKTLIKYAYQHYSISFADNSSVSKEEVLEAIIENDASIKALIAKDEPPKDFVGKGEAKDPVTRSFQVPQKSDDEGKPGLYRVKIGHLPSEEVEAQYRETALAAYCKKMQIGGYVSGEVKATVERVKTLKAPADSQDDDEEMGELLDI